MGRAVAYLVCAFAAAGLVCPGAGGEIAAGAKPTSTEAAAAEPTASDTSAPAASTESITSIPSTSATAKPVDFERDIRPILADNCFHCHGRDDEHRKAKLRLDTAEGAAAAGAIVPGETAASPLVKRITSADPDFQMPPPDSKRSLTGGQIALLTQWVAEGAEYKAHWAFVPIERKVPPPVEDGDHWIENPIDMFVLARLNAEGIAPAPRANKETLLRRVTLDLTGVPPTIEELDAFLADDGPDAYERAIDRLLASPGYGEHMAARWLDVARYADTFGYQTDFEMYVWPWRDWVIDTFNRNMPYDQFMTWQLAGDLLPDATQEQRLATTFNRLHRQTNEGGSIPEEFRVAYVVDRTNTFATAFLGVTMQCAQCHDHKFDPISQKDYYSLFAFFDDIDESGMYSFFTRTTPSPGMFLLTDEEEARKAELARAVDEARSARDAEAGAARDRFTAWLNDPARPVPEPAPVVALPFETIEEGKTANIANAEASVTVAEGVALEPGAIGQAARFDGEAIVDCVDQARFERTQPFSLSLWVKTEEHPEHVVVCHTTMASLDAASRGYELLLEDGRPTVGLTHYWPGNAIRIEAREAIPTGQWVHLAVTYDGTSSAAGVRIYQNGAPMAVDVIRDNLFKTILYDEPDKGPGLKLAARFRDVGFKDSGIDEFRVYDRPLSCAEVAALALNQPVADRIASLLADAAQHDDALFDYYLHAVDGPYKDAAARFQQCAQEENAFLTGLREIMVMEDMAEPRQAYVLSRGAYDAPAEPVEPATPDSILPYPENLPRNRLGLAQWLTDPANPLTARVAVNRYWQMFFGRGLVETQEDFGTQGRAPTHPKLLDWLASEFMNSGWNVQELQKLILLSATYRQDSRPRPDLAERDPLNELLACGPRQRLTAEAIRDSALAASGLLVEKRGGPSVYPYQPGDIWRDASQVSYTEATGEGLYRRSMYTFWKRTVPPPSMLSFDAVAREVCVVRREVTATPLQSLILLNDPQYVEAARVLASRALSAAPEDLDGRIEQIFRALVSREPTSDEVAVLRQAYDEQRDYYLEHPDKAVGILNVGETPAPEGVVDAEAAATAAVAQVIMNLDEFQVRY